MSFFGNGDEPVFPGEPCVEGTIQPRSPSGFILSTRTTFDVLGRVVQVEAPDGSTATSEFDGLVTVTTDARGSQTRSERNALGEVISMRQSDAVTGEATGMEVTHEYDAQGNLRFVRRDAGLGEIVSETRYDVLGYYSAAYWFRQAINVAVVVASAISAQGGASAVSASTLSTGAKLFLIGGAGATTAAVSSGNTRGSGWGAVSALAFYGIGTYFETATWAKAGDKIGVAKSGLNGGGYAAKVLAHGLTGGVLQSKQGGNFGSGFAAAGLTQAAGGYIDGLDGSHPDFSPIRVLSAALVGGTASSITGGKFANGAVTAAFSRAFNAELHGPKNRGQVIVDTSGVPSGMNFADEVDSALNYLDSVDQGVFDTVMDAGFDIHFQYTEGDALAAFSPDLKNPQFAVIRFDPRSGIKFSNGRIQSPALSMFHEALHLARNVAGLSNNRLDGSATNSEERNVIRRELRAARRLGEPVRASHGDGSPARVQCVTCRNIFSE